MYQEFKGLVLKRVQVNIRERRTKPNSRTYTPPVYATPPATINNNALFGNTSIISFIHARQDHPMPRYIDNENLLLCFHVWKNAYRNHQRCKHNMVCEHISYVQKTSNNIHKQKKRTYLDQYTTNGTRPNE